ncbi:pyridoxal-dependent decarboxylase [Synechococcus sp. CCY9202]|uniref:pyridoxal-dependent decarboxylase n=1 Tax=Synechococcus sp. CCY9202 TaxID=174698 RepID=UPI002B1EA64E|nr:pyridoxal-dependent decarboxylase [Synechococcus sp. CCY9202]MEA5422595.1 pyridoxal-dependent decarboxylase [Synechococcus sp. CCY9202]
MRSSQLDLTSQLGSRLRHQKPAADVPRDRLSEEGLPADLTYQLVHDHLMLDGNARLNLATFVGTWMEPEARRLMEECADKNMIDKDEYPQTAELEERCLKILADLWHAPDPDQAIGTSTTGSSEGCMLGGLALKWRWRERRRGAGLDASRPNLVMGINTQVCWEKFCTYFDVEPRLVPLEQNRLHLTPEEALKQCDENTIGVVGIVGSTFDGRYPFRGRDVAAQHSTPDR